MSSVVQQTYDPADVLYNISFDRGSARQEVEGDAYEKIYQGMEDLAHALKKLHHHKQGSKESDSSSSFKNALSSDPFWNKHVLKNNPKNENPSKEEIGNFFYLIFKYMKADEQQNSEIEANQALNMLVQSKLLDTQTLQAQQTATNLKNQIKSDNDALNSPLGQFLSIGLPIMMAALSAAGGAMFGFGSGLMAGAGMALSGAAQAGTSIDSFEVSSKLTDMQDASSEAQADMAVTSAATQSTQTRIQQDQQNTQNANSNLQSDASMIQQEISQMVQALGLGHF